MRESRRAGSREGGVGMGSVAALEPLACAECGRGNSRNGLTTCGWWACEAPLHLSGQCRRSHELAHILRLSGGTK